MSSPSLLLFGTPGAGKSSLLGALAQAASTQPALLKGELVGASSKLIDLQKSTYQAKLESTDDLTAYDIRLQPAAEGEAPLEATLLDCSGVSAREMLQSKQPFADAHPMQKSILNADAMLLIVDASMSGKQLAEEFQQFARWLVQFHETRGRRTEVGELPVYLVLTKCDMLAKPNDTFSMWMQRIEEGKRRIDQKFREYLKNQGVGFGSIQLNVWATAIKRPALTDRPAKAQEPYGVAELFRQCLHAAADYDFRQAVSQSRLHNVVVGMLVLVAMLALAVGFLVEFQPEAKHASLDEALQAVMPKKEAGAADRLRGATTTLEKKRDALTKIVNDPDFERLPGETQKNVATYRGELTQYLDLYNESQTKLKAAHLAKNEQEFKEFEKQARAFQLPESHASDWDETRLGKRVKQVRAEYVRVHEELAKEEAWIRDEIKKNDGLLKQGSKLYSRLLDQQKLEPQEVDLWHLAYREQMQTRSRMPREDYIPGVQRMIYEDLGKFEQVKKAQKDWQASKSRLEKIAALIKG